MSIKVLNEDTYSDFIARGLALVDFWADWCGPCRLVAPIMEDLSLELTDVYFAKLNIDENQQVAMDMNVTSIPAFLLYKEGELVDRMVGSVPAKVLKEFILKHTQ